LGRAASAFIDATIINGDHIGLSAISLAEMVYLIEKGRIPAHALDDILAAIADPKAVLQQVPLDDSIVLKMRTVSRQDIPDLPDRIIAASAQFYGVPLLSRDARIRSSTITRFGDATAGKQVATSAAWSIRILLTTTRHLLSELRLEKTRR
jgi:PIN domain nuclease of toxin-antitoxin system